MLVCIGQLCGLLLAYYFSQLHFHKKELIHAQIIIMIVIAGIILLEGINTFPISLIGLISGIGFLHLLNQAIPHHHESRAEQLSSRIVVALCFHEIPEGIAAVSSYAIDPNLGLPTFLLIALHKIPEGAMATINYFNKKEYLNGIKTAFAIQALFIAGAAFAHFLIAELPAKSFFTSLAAGAMLYLALEEYQMKRWS